MVAAPKWAPRARADAETRGPDLAHALELLELDPHEWQRSTADLALELDPATGFYRFGIVGVCVGRQAGKTSLALGRLTLEIVGGGRAAYTAQDRILAREKWSEYTDELADRLPPGLVKKVSRTNGQEFLALTTGGRFGITTPGRKSGRGRTNDLVLVDEALTHETDEVVGALLPTMATRPNAQLWLLGNAGDWRAAMFRRYRDLGRAASGSLEGRLAWIEYAPSDPNVDVHDPQGWAESMPTLGVEGGVTRQAVADAALAMSPEAFRREYLNVWDDDVDVEAPDDRIDPGEWAELESVSAAPRGRVVFGVDVGPDRLGCSIVSASADPLTVELVDDRRGVGWATPRLADLVDRHGGVVAYDASSQAATVGAELEARSVPTLRLTPERMQSASALVFDHVRARTLTVRRNARFAEAVRDARKGVRGDRWRWVRADASGDIAPLVALTVAVWAATVAPEAPPVPRPAIY